MYTSIKEEPNFSLNITISKADCETLLSSLVLLQDMDIKGEIGRGKYYAYQRAVTDELIDKLTTGILEISKTSIKRLKERPIF